MSRKVFIECGSNIGDTVVLQMELEKSVLWISHFIILLLCRNFIFSFLQSPLSGLFQFLVSLLEDLFFSSFELIPGCNISDGAVKPVFIVMENVLFNQLSCLLKREWAAWSNTFPFQRFVPALEFAVTLRIIRWCANMCNPWYPNELFEILCYKLRSIVWY